MKTALLALALIAISCLAPLAVEARPQGGQGGTVVHSRRGPVIMHRVLPPFRGKHVYGGR